MKRNLLLKTMLLLCALVVGTSSSWGANVNVINENFSTHTTKTSLEEAGWTLSGTTIPSNGYLQIASGSGAGSATTPAFSALVGTTATLSVTHVSSGSASRTMTITGVNCKVNGETSTTVTVPGNGSGATTSTIAITEASSTSKITFSLASGKGTKLNEVVVYYSPSSDPSINATTSLDIECDATSGEFEYTLNNPVTNGVLSATDNVDWITDVTVDAVNSKVTFNTTANTETTPRVGTITMTYKTNDETLATKEVTITQAKLIIILNYSLATQIVPGRRYIITSGTDDGPVNAMGADRGNNHGSVGITVSNGKTSFASDAGVCELIIGGDMSTGFYTLYDVGVEKYISAASSGSNNMKYVTTLDNDAKWTIKIAGDGTAVIQSQGEYTRNTIRHNSGNNPPLFSCYESTKQSDVYLFERDGDTGTQSTSVTLASACTDGTKYFGTYSCPFSFVVPADLTVSAVSVDDGKLVVENYTTGATVKANTGVMVSSTEAGDHNVVLSGAEGTEFSGNMLKATGTGDGISAEDMVAAAPSCTYYRLTMHNGSQIGYWWGANSGAAFAVVANKAYLAVPPSAVGAKVSGFAFEDTTTGIANLNVDANDSFDVNAPMYNLAGQRVTKAYKGVVIVNGKKMLNK